MRNYSEHVFASNTTQTQQAQSNSLLKQPIDQLLREKQHTLDESFDSNRRIQIIRVIRMDELSKRLGLAKSTLYKMLAEKKFPRGFRINGGKATGWLSSTIDQWLLDRADSVKHQEPRS